MTKREKIEVILDTLISCAKEQERYNIGSNLAASLSSQEEINMCKKIILSDTILGE